MSAHSVHSVYFTLKDPSDENISALIDDAHTYLEPFKGIVHFAIGVLEPEALRAVNDRDFHIGLTIVFESRELHDAYQVDPEHDIFVDRNRDKWASLRVFDTAMR